MATNNIYENPIFPQRRNRGGGGITAYLLGMDDNEDENVDPQLQVPQPVPVHNVAGRRIVVRIPVNDKVTRDIEFPTDIPYHDFHDRILASMSLDPATAVLGWKTSDQGKRAAAHELNNHLDMENAFRTILAIQDNPRRRKEFFLEIVHLNPAPVPVPGQKKTDGFDNFHHKASCPGQVNSKSAIHIHINLNNNPLGDTSHHNILGAPHLTRGFKHPRSITSEISTDSDEEPLALADVIETLNQKYPQINLPQYMPILEKEKIVYAETVLEFDKDYLVGLGIPEGATRTLLKGVEKAVGRRKKEKKRIRVSQREESVEI